MSESWWPDFSEKCYFLFTSIFKPFLSKHRFDLLHQQLNRKLYSCGGASEYYLIVFDPCIGIIGIRRLQKVQLITVRLDFRVHFLQNYSSDFCTWVKTWHFHRSMRWKNQRFWSLHQNLDSPEFQNSASSIDIFRKPNSFFSVTQRLVSSIKV